jgi:hypothetical protein
MDRRTFLKLAGYAGFSVVGASVMPNALRAQASHDGPYWITIHASGGWDPTLLCDPKGRRGEEDPSPVNTYDRLDVGEAGPFRYAPVEGHRAFFERFRNDLLVINGIDNQTVSHTVGTQTTWSGLSDPDVPAFTALVAATSEPRPNLAFLSNGGYDQTAGLVAPTRLPDVGAVNRLAFPDRLDPNNPETNLHADSTLARIKDAREARHLRKLKGSSLPRVTRARSVLHDTRTGDNELTKLREFLPESLDGGGNPLVRQAQVAIACFRAGITVSANLARGGFDTHGDHDNAHTPRMQSIVEAVGFIHDEAERQGIAGKVIVLVGSDFARTPWYNDGNGKDHWSITSMMLMGPGIRGGRVIGATDELQSPRSIDPGTLQLSDAGVRIRPADINANLRRLAGFDADPRVARWALSSDMDLLS